MSLALEMLGLNHWKPRLDEIYNQYKRTRNSAQNPRNLKKKAQKNKNSTKRRKKKKGELKVLQNGLKSKHPYNLIRSKNMQRRQNNITTTKPWSSALKCLAIKHY